MTASFENRNRALNSKGLKCLEDIPRTYGYIPVGGGCHVLSKYNFLCETKCLSGFTVGLFINLEAPCCGSNFFIMGTVRY